jgi:hypothetical protein
VSSDGSSSGMVTRGKEVLLLGLIRTLSVFSQRTISFPFLYPLSRSLLALSPPLDYPSHLARYISAFVELSPPSSADPLSLSLSLVPYLAH